MRQNRLKKKYLASVSRNIKCRKKDKQEYLDFVSASVDDFLYEKKDANYVQICQTIGKPGVLAGEFSLTLKPEQKSKYIKNRRIMFSVVAITVASLLAMSYWYLIYEINYIDYIVETPAFVYVDETEEVTSLSQGENL